MYLLFDFESDIFFFVLPQFIIPLLEQIFVIFFKAHINSKLVVLLLKKKTRK